MLIHTFRRLVMALLPLIAVVIQARAAENDSTSAAMMGLIERAKSFTDRMPREKVYVHFDNTGYYRGDKIWFQCYVVNGIDNRPEPLSRTLYVELLNPRGKVVSRQILKVENGRCNGAFTLNHLPFYSGFYEVRAYTKHMLNFGDAAVFSRVIPVFEQPKKAGDFSERKMARGISKYPGKRPGTKAGPKVSMRFFPEGGSLVAGVPTRVAFEVTGRSGVPVDASGRVIDESTGRTVAELHALHEGRGLFELIPEVSGQYKAVISCGADGGEHKFDLPKVRDRGIGLSVDNLSVKDRILVTVRPDKSAGASGMIGLAVSTRGLLWSYSFLDATKERTIKLNSSDMPSGVSIITLFGPDGRTLAERMFFVNNGGYGTVTAAYDKTGLTPLGKLTLDLTATDAAGAPAAQLPLSVSITDGDNAVDHQGGLLSDLLLMSEIKGYVRNPMQYFRKDSEASARNLDLLMMVSGWRCYSWEEMAGINPMGLRYYPENSIDLEGKVVSFGRGIPKANSDLSVMVKQMDVADSLKQTFTNLISTDSCGRFRISYDMNGKWGMVISVSENGKKKDHRIILDRLFSPVPRKYEPAEMAVDSYTGGRLDTASVYADSIKEEEETERLLKQLDDSLSIESIRLGEVVVKGKHNREADIFRARSKSVEYYDMQDELGDLTDKGEVVSKDLFEVLRSLNNNFHRQYFGSQEKLMYKSKEPLFVIDYKITNARDSMNYTLLYPESVKSIFISEDPSIIMKYADPVQFNIFSVEKKYSCAVLIETFPDRRGPAGKGTRMQIIEGYTVPEEYQNIDDAIMLDNPDFRRTLYWAPAITTDADGKARIEFFNNSTCRNIRVSIHGIGPDGTIYTD